MQPIELLFALLLVALLSGVVAVVMLVSALGRRSEAQARDLSELRSQLAVGGRAQDAQAAELRDRLGLTHAAFEAFRSALSARQQMEDEARHSLRRLEAIMAGSSARGAAGENILEEAVRLMPPEMIQRNAWVNGKVVEFALRLPGGKVLPIDSKWTSSQALEELAAPNLEPARRSQLVTQIEREVERRVREVSQYIDPTCTAPWALAAVPDAAYAVCRNAFAEAHKRNVIVVGYSLALPYILALHQMHLQFARTVDVENLQSCLIDIERQVDLLEGTLENKLQRAVVMLQNAYAEGKQVSARVRASTHSLQASERTDGAPSLLVLEQEPKAPGRGIEAPAGGPQANEGRVPAGGVAAPVETHR
ncbi:MAG: DNA recombination protein RmuC [Candidatus Dormibacterales bacterium]